MSIDSRAYVPPALEHKQPDILTLRFNITTSSHLWFPRKYLFACNISASLDTRAGTESFHGFMETARRPLRFIIIIIIWRKEMEHKMCAI